MTYVEFINLMGVYTDNMAILNKNINLTIVIPSKNEEKNIEKSLSALMRVLDGREDVQIILIDNGSTDNTIEVANRFNVQIHILPGVTVAQMRNFGAKFAEGNFISFLDADCLVTKNWLTEIEKYYNNPLIGAVGATPKAPINGTWVQTDWSLIRTRRHAVSEVDWINSSNLIVKKEAFNLIGGFRENLITCEDVDFCYRLKKLYKIIFDPKIEVIHLGEPKNVKEFLMKEVWRGKSNYINFSKFKIEVSEIKSLIIPLYLPFSFIFFLFFVFGYVSFSLILFFVLLPIFLFNLWIAIFSNKLNLNGTIRINVLFLVYCLGRSIALVNNLLKTSFFEGKK